MTNDSDDIESKYQKWKPCPECGNKTVHRDGLISIDRSGLLADVVCDTCGNKEDSSQMYADRKSPAPFVFG
jgi:transcription elongation factor Elf1